MYFVYVVGLLSIIVSVDSEILSSPRDTNVCDLPKAIGPCKARIRRFYFSLNDGKCKRFNYGGCDGNENNFRSLADCEKACSKRVCTLPKDSGPCEAAITKWFYNADTMQCETFIYGGCKGNKNNFETKQKCQNHCEGVKRDPCGPLPPCAPPPPDTCPGFMYDIINGNKCIVGCTYPPCKQGTCPLKPLPDPCNPRCMFSNECTDGQLCCSGCCREAILEPKVGLCPVGLKQQTCYPAKSECEKDGQCSGKRKCCPFGCRKICVDPDEGINN